MVFPVVMYRCESWTIKKAECQSINVFELWCWRRHLRIPWTSVNPTGNQPWILIGRTDADTLATWCEELTHWKRPWCWTDWRQEEKWATGDEMVGRPHRLSGHESKQTLGHSEGQGGLVRCSPREALHTTEQLNKRVTVSRRELHWPKIPLCSDSSFPPPKPEQPLIFLLSP